MLRLVHLETVRAERTSGPLTMVIFALPDNDADQSAEFLETVLPEKIRLSDAAGWLSENEMAVLLPETSIGGARTFLAEFRKFCGKTQSLPNLSLWRYEGKWIAEQETPATPPAKPATLAMSA